MNAFEIRQATRPTMRKLSNAARTGPTPNRTGPRLHMDFSQSPDGVMTLTRGSDDDGDREGEDVLLEEKGSEVA